MGCDIATKIHEKVNKNQDITGMNLIFKFSCITQTV